MAIFGNSAPIFLETMSQPPIKPALFPLLIKQGKSLAVGEYIQGPES